MKPIDNTKRIEELSMIKPVHPKNGDRYKTKDGQWYIFRNGSWKKFQLSTRN